MKTSASAGLLLYRLKEKLEVLLAHPGGPYWKNKDAGAWTVPKGEILEGEDPHQAAIREFMEETGFRPSGDALSLGSLRQAGGKWVHVWAVPQDWDPARLVSNSFSIEWPPRSGRVQEFPEIDRAAWFDLAQARVKILKSQLPFLDRLEQVKGAA
ncbi:MAG: NUDIX domain-containing protein [Hyphomicrobium sp.]